MALTDNLIDGGAGGFLPPQPPQPPQTPDPLSQWLGSGGVSVSPPLTGAPPGFGGGGIPPSEPPPPAGGGGSSGFGGVGGGSFGPALPGGWSGPPVTAPATPGVVRDLQNLFSGIAGILAPGVRSFGGSSGFGTAPASDVRPIPATPTQTPTDSSFGAGFPPLGPGAWELRATENILEDVRKRYPNLSPEQAEQVRLGVNELIHQASRATKIQATPETLSGANLQRWVDAAVKGLQLPPTGPTQSWTPQEWWEAATSGAFLGLPPPQITLQASQPGSTPGTSTQPLGSRGGGGGGGGTTPGLGPGPGPQLPPVPPTTNLPPFLRRFQTPFGETLLFDEGDFGALPSQYRSQLDRILRALGYTPTGLFIGTYGNREWKRDPNAPEVRLTDELLEELVPDQLGRTWMRWFFYHKGMYNTAQTWPGP